MDPAVFPEEIWVNLSKLGVEFAGNANFPWEWAQIALPIDDFQRVRECLQILIFAGFQIKILLYCDVPDIIAFGSTCKYLRKTSDTDYLWWARLIFPRPFDLSSTEIVQLEKEIPKRKVNEEITKLNVNSKSEEKDVAIWANKI